LNPAGAAGDHLHRLQRNRLGRESKKDRDSGYVFKPLVLADFAKIIRRALDRE